MASAIGPEPDVLGQSVKLPGPLAVGLVVGDGVGHFLQRGKAVGRLSHKVTDLANAASLNPGRGVDQHEGLCSDVTFANSGQ